VNINVFSIAVLKDRNLNLISNHLLATVLALDLSRILDTWYEYCSNI